MTKCRACNAEITFTETVNGKMMPTNADGVSHFATCTARLKNRPPAPPDNECASCHSDNVEREPGRGPHFGGLRCHDCGAFRWLRRPQETEA